MIVQKYGGSSLESPQKILKVADRIVADLSKHGRMAVVVSAMGNSTDSLLSLAELVAKNNFPREMDALISTGEQVSASLLSMALGRRGIRACSLNAFQLGIRTDNSYENARIISINRFKIEKALNDMDVLVVTGFQGVSPKGDITTLGRGGSDTTAVALASCCGCPCEIYSDVAGIYTCDPNLLPGAKKLEYITYDDMLLLSTSGAQVLNPVAVETARKNRVPLYCGATFSEETGTRVVSILPEQTELMDVVGVATEKIDNARDEIFQKTGSHEKRTNPCFASSYSMGPLTKVTAVGKVQDHQKWGFQSIESLKKAGVRLFETKIQPGKISALVSERDSKRSVKVLAEEFGLI